jgi:hypothetical protein
MTMMSSSLADGWQNEPLMTGNPCPDLVVSRTIALSRSATLTIHPVALSAPVRG